MTSKLYNILVGTASVSAATYFTTWILTGETPIVRIIYYICFIVISQMKCNVINIF